MDIMDLCQKNDEDVEDFMDRVLLQGMEVELQQKDLLPTIMKGIKADLQEAILRKDPDIANI